jgi:threonine/homoserine/homoserine lactone efflux protein
LVVQHAAGVDSRDRRYSLVLLITNATEFFSIWLRRRRVVMALDSAMGAILIAFGLKLAFDKAH